MRARTAAPNQSVLLRSLQFLVGRRSPKAGELPLGTAPKRRTRATIHCSRLACSFEQIVRRPLLRLGEAALGAALDYAADFIAPPPPPTKEQAERMRRAAEEQREQNAATAPEREKDARLQELLDQIRRNDQQTRYDR